MVENVLERCMILNWGISKEGFVVILVKDVEGWIIVECEVEMKVSVKCILKR